MMFLLDFKRIEANWSLTLSLFMCVGSSTSYGMLHSILKAPTHPQSDQANQHHPIIFLWQSGFCVEASLQDLLHRSHMENKLIRVRRSQNSFGHDLVTKISHISTYFGQIRIPSWRSWSHFHPNDPSWAFLIRDYDQPSVGNSCEKDRHEYVVHISAAKEIVAISLHIIFHPVHFIHKS